MPKLSIVVPVYNVEQYLRQCLDSILGQSFRDFELIIVDDGSSDASGSICDEYAGGNERIQVIHTENKGVVSARRCGVERAAGEYTAFVDSDDWLDTDFYSDIFQCVGEKTADVLICGHVNRGGVFTKTTLHSEGFYDKDALEQKIFPHMMYNLQTQRFNISPSLCVDKLFRTELLRTVYKRIDSTVTLGEDAVCTYPCIALANSLYIINNHACYHYREGHTSMVTDCDMGLLQRVCALADNMNVQFSDLSDTFRKQVQVFTAYNSLYAAQQVLMYNRKVSLKRRAAAAKEFFRQPVIAHSVSETIALPISKKFKNKLMLASKNQICFWLLLKINHIIQKLK